jgi:uncharacterized protein (AIM24 family)
MEINLLNKKNKEQTRINNNRKSIESKKLTNNKANNNLESKKLTNNKANNNLESKKLENNKQITLIKQNNRNNNILSIFPKYELEGGSGFQSLKIKLKPNETIIANGGGMNYMSSGVIDTVQTMNKSNSFFKSVKSIFGRAFSGSSIFYNIYENPTEIEQFVSLSSNTPGNIGTFLIPHGRELNVFSDSYICSTNNLDVSGSTKFGGILLGYGLFFVNIKLKENQSVGNSGLVWVSSFGDVIEHKLSPGESLIVNNGVFLAFDSQIDINTRTVKAKNTYSSIKGLLFSGEGLVSEMKNNTSEVKSVFLQSRSKIFYNDYIKNICEQEIIEETTKSSLLSSIMPSSESKDNNSQSSSFFSGFSFY